MNDFNFEGAFDVTIRIDFWLFSFARHFLGNKFGLEFVISSSISRLLEK